MPYTFDFVPYWKAEVLEWLNMQVGGSLSVWYRHTEEADYTDPTNLL